MPLRNPFRGSKQRKKINRKCFVFEKDIEALEPRRLLTTITGGQSFEYQDINGAVDRVTATGNITAELIGASVDRGSNKLTLIDLPGALYDTGGRVTQLNGGLTSPQGVSVIGLIRITDPFDPNGNVNGTIGGLATDNSGVLYGVNVVIPQNTGGTGGTGNNTTPPNLLQIVQIDSRTAAGTVVAEVHTQALAAASVFSAFAGGANNAPPQITGATAAAFNPINNILYFVATGGANNTPVLFTIDVHATDIPGSLRAIPGTFRSNGGAATNVGGMVFDRTSGVTARLVAALNIGANSQLDTINLGNSDLWTEQVPMNTGGIPIVGLSIYFDNPNQEDNVFYGLTGQATAGGGVAGGNGNVPIQSGEEVQITVNPNGSSTVVSFGALNTQTVNLLTGPQQGAVETNPGDLTFDPTIQDPFTGLTGALVGTDLTTHDLFILSPTNRTPTTTLFAIYVAQSDASGGISVATTPTPPASPRPMLPFQGSVGSVRIKFGNTEINAPANSGAVLLGAKTVQLTNQPTSGDNPILSGTLDTGHGVFPGGAGTQVEAGLVVAPGQVMGKFLFGGAIMGQVIIHGSIDQFYCGWLITGDATGGTYSTAPFSNGINFLVDGDIRNLYVLGPIGTDPTYGANQGSSIAQAGTGAGTAGGPALDTPTYDTGFNMYVGGTLGQIRDGGSAIGTFVVAHTATTATTTFLPNFQNEAEYIPTPAEKNAQGGGPGQFGGLSAWDDVELGGNALFQNDTFQTAEILASLPSTVNGPGTAESVNGQLFASVNRNDYVDYYGVPLMAGQTVSVQLTNALEELGFGQTAVVPGDLQIGVFDPDDRLIATDVNDVLLSQTSGLPFKFTADRPGIYRFAVSEEDNPTFTPANNPGLLADFSYTLNISNVGDIALGAISTFGSFLDRGITVQHGDLGAVECGATTIYLPSGNVFVGIPDAVDVPFGNLRVVEAASIGIGLDGSPGIRGAATGTYGPPGARLTSAPTVTTAPGTSNNGVSEGRETAVSFTLGTGYDLNVPNGSVGLLDAYGSGVANVMYINDNNLAPVPIGGNIQLINCAGSLAGAIYTNGGIGTIRCGDINIPTTTQIRVNVDGIGDDGIIDLIDCLGDFGSLGAGGPEMSTGPGGNIRYIRVGGAVYRDHTFGSGQDDVTSYSPGVSATIVDDSGSLIHITPEGDVPNPNFVAGTTDETSPAFSQFNPASLTLTTYPIEGSGGSVIIDATSSGSLTITSNGDVPGQTAEIGRIEVQGPGTGVINTTTVTTQGTAKAIGLIKVPPAQQTQPAAPAAGATGTTGTTVTVSGGTTAATTGTGSVFTSPPPTTAGPGGSPGLTMATTGNPLFVHLSGPANVDVFDIVVVNNGQILGNATEITNTSGGEIVNVLAQSIGRLFSTGSIGVAEQHTAAAVNPMQIITAANQLTGTAVENYPVDADVTAGHFFGNLYPFVQQRIGIVVMGGNLLSVEAPVIGNIMVNGSIGQVIADGNTPGQGIVAPVVAYNLSLPTTQNRFGLNSPANPGDIGSIQIGGGISPTGSGSVGQSGVFVDNRVGSINGTGADIRGNIVTGLGVDSITLHNGSIINADFATPGPGFQGTIIEIPALRIISSINLPQNQALLDWGAITVSGNGGIIGLDMEATHIGAISVNGGFGLFNSLIDNQAGGSINSIKVDGYGLRNDYIAGGISIGSINVTQNGQQIPSSNFSPDVRASETTSFDNYFGFAPNFLTDIDSYLGTNATKTTSAETDGGIIEDTTIVGERDLGSIRAFSYRTNGLVTPVVVTSGLPPLPVLTSLLPATDQGFADIINFGNSIGTMTSIGVVDGLSVITGTIKKLQFNSDVSRLDMELAGKINTLNINGNLDDGSVIFAKGRNGNIGTVHVKGNLNGTIKAQKKIGTLIVGGSLSGTVDAANITKIQAGSLNTGNLTIDGNLQNLISLGDLGTPGQSILVHGSVGKIQVAGNMNTSTTVQGNLKMLRVGGSITSGTNIDVTNTLTALLVNGDLQANATVKAHLIKNKKIKGQTLGSIITGA